MSHAVVLALALLVAPAAAHGSQAGGGNGEPVMDVSPAQRGHPDTGFERGLVFEDVYRAQARYVQRLLGRMGVRDADRPDACQEVFLVVHRHLARLEGEEALRSWLFGISRRVAAAFRRRPHVRHERQALPFTLAAAAGPFEAVAAGEDRARLDRILGSLDEGPRTVFVKYEIEGLPMAEVAALLKCPLQTAYSRLHVARLKIEGALGLRGPASSGGSARLGRRDHRARRSGAAGAAGAAG